MHQALTPCSRSVEKMPVEVTWRSAVVAFSWLKAWSRRIACWVKPSTSSSHEKLQVGARCQARMLLCRPTSCEAPPVLLLMPQNSAILKHLRPKSSASEQTSVMHRMSQALGNAMLVCWANDWRLLRRSAGHSWSSAGVGGSAACGKPPVSKSSQLTTQHCGPRSLRRWTKTMHQRAFLTLVSRSASCLHRPSRRSVHLHRPSRLGDRQWHHRHRVLRDLGVVATQPAQLPAVLSRPEPMPPATIYSLRMERA